MRTAPLGLLEIRMHIAAEFEQELNNWYDREHVAELLSIPGVLSATRYTELIDGMRMYRSLYELEDERVVSSKEFHRLLAQRTPWSQRMYALYDNHHRLRNTYRLLNARGRGSLYDAPWLYCFKTDVDPETERDFNDSYDTELLDALAAVPGCVGARRFVAVDAPQKYMALYGLDSLDVVDSEAWQAAANTPWRVRIRSRLRNPVKGYFQLLRPTVRRVT